MSSVSNLHKWVTTIISFTGEFVRVADLFYEKGSRFYVCLLKASLNHIWRELLITELAYSSLEDHENRFANFRIPVLNIINELERSYIDYFRYCIVPVWVLNKVNHVFWHFLEKLPFLVLANSAWDELLDDAEAVCIFSQLYEMCEYFIKDELPFHFVKALHHFLNNMGALRVFGKSDDVSNKCGPYEVLFLG
jgi:hypothetical protein